MGQLQFAATGLQKLSVLTGPRFEVEWTQVYQLLFQPSPTPVIPN